MTDKGAMSSYIQVGDKFIPFPVEYHKVKLSREEEMFNYMSAAIVGLMLVFAILIVW